MAQKVGEEAKDNLKILIETKLLKV